MVLRGKPAGDPSSIARIAVEKQPQRTLDYTRRHVVVALLAAGRSRAQAAKYVRISRESLQCVADRNSRFRYDMQKTELDCQNRKARKGLKRSQQADASPAEASAMAEAAAQSQEIAEAELPQCTREPDGALSAERADLENVTRANGGFKQVQQLALVRPDVDLRQARRRLAPSAASGRTNRSTTGRRN